MLQDIGRGGVAARAEKQIVDRQEALPIGQANLGHGQYRNGRVPAPGRPDYGRQVFHRKEQQHPGKAARVWIDRDHSSNLKGPPAKPGIFP